MCNTFNQLETAMKLKSWRGMRTKWAFKRQILKNVSAGLAIAFFLLLGITLKNTEIISSVAASEARSRAKIEEVFVSCMNNGAAFINDELHLCRPVNTWVKK
jgi:hypothetical protein